MRKASNMCIEVDFTKVSETELKEMQEAGHNVINCHRILAKTSANIVGELLRGQEEFFEWDHYPDSDKYDFEDHGQYYYHAHPKEERPGEHGYSIHFCARMECRRARRRRSLKILRCWKIPMTHSVT